MLSRLDGETRTDAGGYVLRPHDAFLKRSHVPVEVKVAAKDNDPVTGPKWGESEAFTIVPPEVGEPEELRLAALRAMRKAYVEALAYRLSHGDKGQEPFVASDARELSSTAKAQVSSLTESFAGLRVPSRSEVRVRVQLRKLAEAEAKELVRPTAESRRAAIVANERVVLVVDAVLRGLAVRDAKSVARELADGADDLALGALKARLPNEGASGTTRMDAATLVVRAGGKHLATLGALGADLGEIVECALLRVDRARAAQDLVHAELAAKDLAVRLRSPDPSFGARGGSGGGASTSGEGGGEGAEDSAEQTKQFAQAIADTKLEVGERRLNLLTVAFVQPQHAQLLSTKSGGPRSRIEFHLQDFTEAEVAEVVQKGLKLCEASDNEGTLSVTGEIADGRDGNARHGQVRAESMSEGVNSLDIDARLCLRSFDPLTDNRTGHGARQPSRSGPRRG